jgi:hypothetical protein
MKTFSIIDFFLLTILLTNFFFKYFFSTKYNINKSRFSLYRLRVKAISGKRRKTKQKRGEWDTNELSLNHLPTEVPLEGMQIPHLLLLCPR